VEKQQKLAKLAEIAENKPASKSPNKPKPMYQRSHTFPGIGEGGQNGHNLLGYNNKNSLAGGQSKSLMLNNGTTLYMNTPLEMTSGMGQSYLNNTYHTNNTHNNSIGNYSSIFGGGGSKFSSMRSRASASSQNNGSSFFIMPKMVFSPMPKLFHAPKKQYETNTYFDRSDVDHRFKDGGQGDPLNRVRQRLGILK